MLKTSLNRTDKDNIFAGNLYDYHWQERNGLKRMLGVNRSSKHLGKTWFTRWIKSHWKRVRKYNPGMQRARIYLFLLPFLSIFSFLLSLVSYYPPVLSFLCLVIPLLNSVQNSHFFSDSLLAGRVTSCLEVGLKNGSHGKVPWHFLCKTINISWKPHARWRWW